VKKVAAAAAAESPVVLFLLLFSSGTAPWPTSMLPYVVGTVVITPVARSSRWTGYSDAALSGLPSG